MQIHFVINISDTNSFNVINNHKDEIHKEV